MIALALLCAAAASGSGAGAAAAVVPSNVDGAVLLDGSRAAEGLRAFFDGVARRAPALEAGPRLSALVGPDLLGEPLSWGLAPSGARAIVLRGGSFGLTAPVRNARAARAALQSWLAALGPPHPVRAGRVRGALSAGDGQRVRAGAVASIAGRTRLLTASGPQAVALLALLGQVASRASAPISTDPVLAPGLSRLTGPAALLARGADPLQAAVLSLEGAASGLVARGLLLAPAPLLAGSAPGPAACTGASLLCLRAGLGPSGRDALALAARSYLGALLAPPSREGLERLAISATAAAERVVVRSDGADARLLTDERDAPWAVRLQAITAPPAGEGFAEADGPRRLCVRADASSAWFGTPCPAAAPADPRAPGATSALEAQLGLGAADAVLQKLTPLDALHGGLGAGLYAGRLTAGGLLRSSGPVVATGRPHPAGAEIELRWPLH